MAKKKDKRKNLVRINEDQLAAIQKICKARVGYTKGACIREAISQWLERRQTA